MIYNKYKVKTLLIILIGIVITTGSCDKEEDTGLYPEGICCQIDGVAWKEKESITSMFVGGILSVKGTNVDGSSLQINMENRDIGTYIINSFTNICIYSEGSMNYTPLNSEQGTLKVMAHDSLTRQIQGVFSFTGANSQNDRKYITDGTFNIIYSDN